MTPPIVNLTKYEVSAELASAGVFDPMLGDLSVSQTKHVIAALLEFGPPPCEDELVYRAEKLADIAKQSGADNALIDGEPYLMSHLEKALMCRLITPCYAFRKPNVGKFMGFIEVT